MTEELFYVELVLFVVVRGQLIVWMLGQIILVGHKRPDTTKLENTLTSIQDGKLIHRGEVFAQSIAKVLGADRREDGYIEGNGYIVSWCIGHLVELAQPEDYDEKYSKWRYADLPIFPADWKYKVSSDTKKQFGILKRLMARNDIKRHNMMNVYSLVHLKNQTERAVGQTRFSLK